MILLISAATFVVPSGALADVARLDPERLTWSHLRFEARKLFAEAETTVDIARVDPGAVRTELMAPGGERTFEPIGAETLVLRLASSFVGRRSASRVWLDAHRGLALQRLKQRFGKKAYQKTYRFGREGVFSERRAPQNHDEAAKDAASWTHVNETFYAAASGCTTLLEPEALLYWVSASPLSPGQSLAFCAFSNKTFIPTVLTAEGLTDLKVDYVVRTGEGERTIDGDVKVLKISLSPRPSSDGSEEDTLEFLGLEGDVEIYLDTTNRLPVQVDGRLPGLLGHVEIKLREAVLR